MNEPVGIPDTVPPKKNNTVLIIVIVLVVLCCCCAAIFGAGYWFYKNYDTLGDPFGVYGLLPLLTPYL
jgi:flagellar basal body-associated protein FliL